MHFLDSNVLVYAALDQSPDKKAIAGHLIAEAVETGTGVVSLQTLREFANVLFRKSGLAAVQIKSAVDGLATLPLVVDSLAQIERGVEIKERFGLQFYDALVVASAEAAGCDTIYSEDMADGAVYGSVRVVDPFRHSPGKQPAVPGSPRSRTRRSKK